MSEIYDINLLERDLFFVNMVCIVVSQMCIHNNYNYFCSLLENVCVKPQVFKLVMKAHANSVA